MSSTPIHVDLHGFIPTVLKCTIIMTTTKSNRLSLHEIEDILYKMGELKAYESLMKHIKERDTLIDILIETLIEINKQNPTK